jgi:hypothetical protein
MEAKKYKKWEIWVISDHKITEFEYSDYKSKKEFEISILSSSLSNYRKSISKALGKLLCNKKVFHSFLLQTKCFFFYRDKILLDYKTWYFYKEDFFYLQSVDCASSSLYWALFFNFANETILIINQWIMNFHHLIYHWWLIIRMNYCFCKREAWMYCCGNRLIIYYCEICVDDRWDDNFRFMWILILLPYNFPTFYYDVP